MLLKIRLSYSNVHYLPASFLQLERIEYGLVAFHVCRCRNTSLSPFSCGRRFFTLISLSRWLLHSSCTPSPSCSTPSSCSNSVCNPKELISSSHILLINHLTSRLTSVKPSGGGFIIIVVGVRGGMQRCFFYGARNLEGIRFYFGYLRDLYLIGLAPW